MKTALWCGIISLLLLGGCDSTDHVVFVTVTNIGIDADAQSQTANIGYQRTEGMVGPAYVDGGQLPQAVSILSSNLSIFSPQIKQLYATGHAAAVATNKNLAPQDTVQPATGARRIMFFGTNSNIGLKLGFAGDMPSSIILGYKRQEMSIIPLHKDNPGAQNPDVYPSVLATIDMNVTSSSLPQSGVGVTQVFATGIPAENLAALPNVRDTFASVVNAAVASGIQGAKDLQGQANKIAACINPSSGTFNAGATQRRDAFAQNAVTAGQLTSDKAALFKQQTSSQNLVALLTHTLISDVPSLYAITQQQPSLCG